MINHSFFITALAISLRFFRFSNANFSSSFNLLISSSSKEILFKRDSSKLPRSNSFLPFSVIVITMPLPTWIAALLFKTPIQAFISWIERPVSCFILSSNFALFLIVFRKTFSGKPFVKAFFPFSPRTRTSFTSSFILSTSLLCNHCKARITSTSFKSLLFTSSEKTEVCLSKGTIFLSRGCRVFIRSFMSLI